MRYTISYTATECDGNFRSYPTQKDGKTVVEFEGLTRNGYEFLEWNTKPDGSGRAYTGEQLGEVDYDLHLYAYWVIVS